MISSSQLDCVIRAEDLVCMQQWATYSSWEQVLVASPHSERHNSRISIPHHSY
jgi:hypothetical protein